MKQILAFIFFLLFAFPAHAGFADVFTGRFDSTVNEVYAEPENIEVVLPTAIGGVIQIILGFASVILVVVVVYASFLWLTARGDEGQVQKAKTWLRNGVVGLFITLMSFFLTAFIVNQLQSAFRRDSRVQTPTAPPAQDNVIEGVDVFEPFPQLDDGQLPA